MDELRKPDFWRARGLFASGWWLLPARAVLAGVYPGRVFVDDQASPTAALVWATGRWAYVAGAAAALEAELRAVFVGAVQPTLAAQQRFEIYAAADFAVLAAVEAALAEFRPQFHLEQTFWFDAERYRAARRAIELPDGAEIVAAELPLLEPSQPQPRGYTEVRTLAFQLRRGDDLLAQARLNGFQLDGAAMIDVATYAVAERRRGYARLVTQALLDACIARGIRPVWETTVQNRASQRLARTSGFVPVERYPVCELRWT